MGQVLRATFDDNLLASAKSVGAPTATDEPGNTIDINPETYATCKENALPIEMEYQFDRQQTFNVAMVTEYIAAGQRVEKFAIDAWVDEQWKQITDATTVGYKRLCRFDDVTTDRVRLRIEQSRSSPRLSAFGLFYAPPILTAPIIARDAKGMIQITAQPGVEVRYTIDGAQPDKQSPKYVKPFRLPLGGLIRARALPGDTTLDFGTDSSAEYEFGREKANWKIHSVDSEEPRARNDARFAIDDDPATFWHTEWVTANPGYPHEVVIDLGESLELRGFSFLPRQDGSDGGLVAQYEFFVSDDPHRWNAAAAKGVFANILNNPIRQRVVFDKHHRGRYVRFVALASPNSKPWAGAAEIDVLGPK